jgi:hypothetical protein
VPGGESNAEHQKTLNCVAAAINCRMNHSSDLSVDNVTEIYHCGRGTSSHFPLFQQVDPADMDRMLEPKRMRSLCNAFTFKKGISQLLKSGNRKFLYLELEMFSLYKHYVFGPNKEEVTGEWKLLHNEEVEVLYCSPNIARVIK